MYDKKAKGCIIATDFIAVSVELLSPKFEDKLKAVFEVFDCDGNGSLSPAEIWSVMSHVPLQSTVRPS